MISVTVEHVSLKPASVGLAFMRFHARATGLLEVIAGPVLDYERFVIATTDRSIIIPAARLFGVGIRPVNISYEPIGLGS